MTKTEENIKDLVKYLATAADIAGALSEDPTLSKQQQRQFDRLFDRLHKEWVPLATVRDWFGIFEIVRGDENEIQNQRS